MKTHSFMGCSWVHYFVLCISWVFHEDHGNSMVTAWISECNRQADCSSMRYTSKKHNVKCFVACGNCRGSGCTNSEVTENDDSDEDAACMSNYLYYTHFYFKLEPTQLCTSSIIHTVQSIVHVIIIVQSTYHVFPW